MTKNEIKSLQHRMNVFVKTYLDGLGPIRVDGELGPSTRGRIRTIKYYLGYLTPQGSNHLSSDPNHVFRSRLWHPKNVRYSTPARLARAAKRRIAQRRKARKNAKIAVKASGVGTFDGRSCANWMIPYLQWARAHGWRGTLTSGWRDPAYSESLCYRMCGAPRCSGRCAGRSSNHSGSVSPRGAVDVSDYANFGRIIRSYPGSPRIFNALGSRDPVHFSSTGN